MSAARRPVRAKDPAKITQKQKEHHERYDIIIVGAGVTGLAGAMYAGRLNLKTLVIGDVPVGGVITLTDVVENYPGFKRLTGLELAQKIKDHALEYPIKFEDDKVVKIKKVDDNGRVFYTVLTEAGKTFHSKTLLFATGTKHRELGIKG